jgi:amino acid adenylation domain-containing protein
VTRLLQHYLDIQADIRPDETALVMGAERMTFGELSVASNRLARQLKDIGCQPGDRVAFLMPKSPVAIVSMIGTLKADCVYVPMDPANPTARLARVIASSEPRCLLASGSVGTSVQTLVLEHPTDISVGWMDARDPEAELPIRPAFRWSDLAGVDDGPLEYRAQPDHPAHLLFTSGSTGQPKGVVITHSMVIGFVEWAVRYFGIIEHDRLSGHSPLHFDLSTFDIYGALAAGAQLHLVPAELNLVPNRLAEFIRGAELTQWFSVPSVLSYMAGQDVVAHDDFPALKRVLWCGEVFPTPALITWMERLPHVTFTNLYGPTETTIASSYYTVPSIPGSPTQPIPIGRACDGEELLVLDADLRAVPAGETGDLYICGVGLSPGYWRDPSLTDAAFIGHPRDPTRRIYRTGDKASIDEQGLTWFRGRDDAQIKSRGYRIELGEIETALNAIAEISQCAVVAIRSNGFEGSTICCAYVPANGTDLTSAFIRTELARSVPAYMLPTRWLRLDALPRNVNGKIDRPTLRERFEVHA